MQLAKSGHIPFNRAARREGAIFSGLTKCEACGSSYVMRGRDDLACAGRMRGTCTNRRTIKRVELESRILAAMRDKLMAPDKFERFCRVFRERLNARRREQLAANAVARRAIVAVERKIQGVMAAIEDGIRTSTTKAHLLALERQKAEMEQALNVTPAPALHPNMAETFRRCVTLLSLGLSRPEAQVRATDAIRSLIHRIEIQVDGGLRLFGNLAKMLQVASEGATLSNVDGCGGLQPAVLAAMERGGMNMADALGL